MKIGNFFAFKQTGIPLGFSVGIGVSVLISYSLRYGKPERNPHGLLFIFLNVSDNVQCNAFLGEKLVRTVCDNLLSEYLIIPVKIFLSCHQIPCQALSRLDLEF